MRIMIGSFDETEWDGLYKQCSLSYFMASDAWALSSAVASLSKMAWQNTSGSGLHTVENMSFERVLLDGRRDPHGSGAAGNCRFVWKDTG